MTDSLNNTPELTLIRGDYRWTPACQRAFLEELACSGSVTQACGHVAKSPRSAYDLRFRRDGAALALGWDAAILVARIVVADLLMDRALNGYEEVSVKHDDGSRVRRKQDNRLGQNLLARLDKMAQEQALAGSRAAHAQMVTGDFEAYLDLIEHGGTGAAAAMFIATRMGNSAHIDADEKQAIGCELARISAAEAMAAERARVLAERIPDMLDEEPELAAQRLSIWYDDMESCWKTNFPVHEGENNYYAHETAFFGDEDYERPLTAEEEVAHFASLTAQRQPWIDAAIAARDAWFGGKIAA
jgi:hypothetical protein